ncbi:MAG: hypothetical protein KAH32_02120 [Chlamydiia bacterium]|nr:hypothetical protein [Chlamydiia bacterium]
MKQTTANTLSIPKKWKDFIDNIQNKISAEEFNTWLSDISISSINDNEMSVNVPHVWHQQHIKENYWNEIQSFINPHHSSSKIKISFKLIDSQNSPRSIVHKKRIKKTRVLEGIKGSFIIKTGKTFENFFVGEENSQTVSIIDTFSRTDKSVVNILFIQGGSGLGKTHILHAIANRFFSYCPSHNFKYYMNNVKDFITSISQNYKFDIVNEIKFEFTNVNIILLDDLHIIQNNSSMEEILCKFLDYLSYSKHIKIVFASSIPLKDLNISERLRSRILQGLAVSFLAPSKFTIKNIIESKMSTRNISISDENIKKITKICSGDARQIEGILNTITVITNNQDLQQEDSIKSVISSYSNVILENTIEFNTSNSDNNVNISTIIETVGKHYGISCEHIMFSNSHVATHARAICMYLDKEINYKKTTADVGKPFKKSHSTAVRAIQKISKIIKNNDNLLSVLSRIKRALKEIYGGQTSTKTTSPSISLTSKS